MMSDIYDKTRLVVAKRHDEKYPMVVAAMSESTWEIFDPEEWDRWRNKRAQEYFDADWTEYEYIEVVVTIPSADLAALFDAREMTPTSVRRAA
jgi:hypothetical protein